jgi:hypothetical protein
MKRYHLSFIVSSKAMTRHDLNVWIKQTQQATGIKFTLDAMIDEGGQMFVNGDQSICAVVTDFDEENQDIIESVNAQPKH